MAYLILSILLWAWDNWSYDGIARKNQARREATQAYQQGDFDSSADQLEGLMRRSVFVEPAARLQLAHAYFRLKRLPEAKAYYRQVAQVREGALSATAHVQLGIIACQQGDSAAALGHFRQALTANPDNEPARYNFELIQKLYSGRQQPTSGARKVFRKPQIAEGDGIVKPGDPNSGNEVARDSRREQLLRRLRSLKLSEEQALLILNSLQENEVQYINQRKLPNSRSARNRNEYKTW